MKKIEHTLQFLFWSATFLLLGCDSKETRLQQFLLKGNLAATELNYSQAAYYYGEAINLDPCFADAHNNLGTVHFQQKQWELALASYNKALECKPRFLGALLNRANTAYELKEYFNALKDLEEVKSLRPDTALVYFTIGLVHTKMRDFDRALLAFDKVISMEPGNVEAMIN
ncbi:MAG: tetratricopeptide repeat protein, partial [Bacteroidota bacterium]